MNPTDPTPTPAAPDWRELCRELLEAIDDDVIDCNDGPRFQAVVDRVRAALATPPAPTREAIDPDADDVQVLAAIVRDVDDSNRLGAAALAEAILSHPLWPELLPPAATTPPDAPPDTARIESLRTALREVIDACGGLATADVSDEFLCLAPGEVRSQLAKTRRGTPPAPTPEAPPVPGQGAEISDEELDEMAIAAGMDPMHGADDEGPRDYWEAWDHQLYTFARAIWDRAQAAVAPVPVSDPEDPPAGPIPESDLRQQWNAQADEFNQWESLGLCEQLAWAQARAIAADRARYGRPTVAPVPVSEPAAAAGEVQP
jgi:hypothetical protein